MSAHQNIQLRLMIPHQHRRPCLLQPPLGILHVKPHAREGVHGPFEGARGSPLAEAAVADAGEERGGEGAVAGAEEEGEEGGGAAAVEFDGGGVEEEAEQDEALGEGEDGDEGYGEEGEEEEHGGGRDVVSESGGVACGGNFSSLAVV